LTSSTPIRYRSSRRASSIEVATTRTTILATASQEHLSSLEIVVLSARWASQATTSSKSFVCRAPGRAHGTSSVTTLSHLGLEVQAARPEVQVSPPADGAVVGGPGGAAARGAAEPLGAAPERDHDAGGGELHAGHGGPGQAQHLVECGADAHVSPLPGKVRMVGEPPNLPRERHVRVFRCRSLGACWARTHWSGPPHWAHAGVTSPTGT